MTDGGAEPDLPRTLPRKRDDLMIAEFDTELVVLVPETRKAHHLDDGLSLVLSSCDGATPTAKLVTEVADGTGEDAAAVARWLVGSISALAELNMLEGSSDTGW